MGFEPWWSGAQNKPKNARLAGLKLGDSWEVMDLAGVRKVVLPTKHMAMSVFAIMELLEHFSSAGQWNRIYRPPHYVQWAISLTNETPHVANSFATVWKLLFKLHQFLFNIQDFPDDPYGRR